MVSKLASAPAFSTIKVEDFHPDFGVKSILSDDIVQGTNPITKKTRDYRVIGFVDGENQKCLCLCVPDIDLKASPNEFIKKIFDYQRFDKEDDFKKARTQFKKDPWSTAKATAGACGDEVPIGSPLPVIQTITINDFNPEFGTKEVLGDTIVQANNLYGDAAVNYRIIAFIDGENQHCVCLCTPDIDLKQHPTEIIRKVYDYQRFDAADEFSKFMMSVIADPYSAAAATAGPGC